MDILGIKAGMTIGEAGAGDGYFTFYLSERVGKTGKIFANDIEEDKLDKISKKCKDGSITNITTILGEQTDPLFPQNQMDMVVMMYVFHDLTKPVEFLLNIRKYLKPGAQVVIIDRDPDKYGASYDHFLTSGQIKKIVIEAKYKLIKIETFLSRDNIYVLEPESR